MPSAVVVEVSGLWPLGTLVADTLAPASGVPLGSFTVTLKSPLIGAVGVRVRVVDNVPPATTVSVFDVVFTYPVLDARSV